MKRTIIGLAGIWLSSGLAFGEPPIYWQFDEGKPGEIAAEGGVFEKGAPPVCDSEIPLAEVWDGGSYAVANPDNKGSLRFTNDGESRSLSPSGGEATVSGADPRTQSANLTVEAFVKVRRQMPHHVLLVSKRRDGQSGASWSLSIDPEGRLRVRIDTQTGAEGSDAAGFNQSVGSSASFADGEWHHVALTFDHETLSAVLYFDYEQCGARVSAGPLVYDDSILVIGRGLDGWIDEVRITAEVLRPEQFLRATRYFADLKKRKSYPVFLDQTHTRVQSALKPDLERIGTLIPKSVDEIGTSMWSLGCETLDRDLANWDAYKGYLQPLGIRRIRLQGGWNRTEKTKGEYDFAWLDQIVDDAIARGLEVCLETSYNNRLYEPKGATGPGGQLPEGDETLAAWDKWVEAMVGRYAPKGVREWMMYNEPNLRKENTVDRIVANNIRTAEIIKRVDPEARIGAFVLAGLKVGLLEELLTKVKEEGKLNLFHWTIYHGYAGNPDQLNQSMDELNALLKRIAPEIRPWQGEAGCASEEVQYALSGIDWTEYSHAKWNARRMLCDLGHDVESSVFTISDLAYHKDFISRYGLLKTNPDNAIIKVKDAFYTVQNVVSVFNDALARVPDYDLTIEGTEKELNCFAFRDRESGLDVIAFWDGAEIPSNASDIELVDVTAKGGHLETPVWIDMITGNIYEIPAEQVIREGDVVTFKGVPLYDGPGVIADRSLLSFEPARKKKEKAKKSPEKAGPKMNTFLLPGTQQPAPAVVIVGAADETSAEIAKWLNGQDVHAFVVESGGKGALEYVRSRAAEWQIKADAVGVMALGGAARAAALEAGANADFTVLIATKEGETFEPLPEPKPKGLFAGKKDEWKEPLAAFLEKRKGKVF